MACEIFYNGKKYTDDEFLHYLASRGVTEDVLTREKNLMDRAVKLAYEVDGVYRKLITEDPRGILNEIAQQANQSAPEKRGAISTFGQELVDIAQELFPNVKSGDAYLQTDSTVPAPASAATMKKFREFNARIGVDEKALTDIVVNGEKLKGVNAIAEPYKGLIQIVDGKQDVALPEESMHIAVEILQQTSAPLFTALMKDVNNHPEYQQVLTNYASNALYRTKDDTPDIIKLKKEAIAKVLAKIVGGIVDDTADKVAVAKTRTLWQRIVDFFKSLFTKAGFDPFETVAEKVVSGEDFGKIEDLGAGDEVFLQKNDELNNKIKSVSNTIARKGSEYTVNGNKVKHSVDEDVRIDLENKFKNNTALQQDLTAWRKEYRGKVENEISNIANRYIDDAGLIRTEYNDNPLTSVIDPYDLKFVNGLDSWFRDKIESYPDGTRFLINKALYNATADKAGFANFIAITNEGKVDLNQFILNTPTAREKDIPQKLQGSYNLEIQRLKDILKKAYGVTEGDFRETRVIPIKVTYGIDDEGAFDLVDMKIGNADVKLEKDVSLLPVPALSESTGNKHLDKLIARFRASAEQLSNQRAPEGQDKIKKQRVAELFAAVRQLQVQREATALLKSANNVSNYEESKFPDLEKKVQETDPLVAQEGGLNKLAGQIQQSINRLSPYVDLGETTRAIYGPKDENGYTETAKEISDQAKNTTNDLYRLQDYLRTDKFSKVSGIADELTPEKNLTFIRKNLLPLSHGVIKSQGQLWHLVEYTSNRYHLRYSDLINKIKELQQNIQKAGFTPDQLNKKIFAYDNKGRRTGDVIQKIDKSFGETISKALRARDIKKIRESIDVDAYKQWYDAKLQSIEEWAQHYQFEDIPEDNERARVNFVNSWKNSHDIDKPTAANRANEDVYKFPKEHIWDSPGYNELKKPENKPLMELYNFWQTLTDRAAKAGMFENYRDRYGFFPDVHKSLIERASTKGGLKEGILQPWAGLQTHENDDIFGEFDPVTYQPVNKVKPQYIRDLGRRVEDTDGTYFKDYSHVSDDLVKSIYMFAGDIVKFELKAETEELAKMILYTEGRKDTFKLKNKQGEPQPTPNNTNVDAIRQYLDFYWYDKRIEGEDFTVDVNVGKLARGVNSLLGFTGIKPMVEPKQDVVTLSGIKLLNTTGRYFRTKTLALAPLSAIANLFGGSANAFINSGDYFSKTDLVRANARLWSSGSWGDKSGQVRAGLLHYFKNELSDTQRTNARKFSVYPAVKYLSSDYLFALMRGSDELVNNTVALAYFDNTLYQDGKLINIVQKVRAENGWDKKSKLSPSERSALNDKISAEIEELKNNSPDLLVRKSVVDEKGHITIPEISEAEFARYRQRLLQMNKEMLGNMSTEDLSLYHRQAVFSNFMMFKNWIPELVYKRMGPLELNYGTKEYGYGRTRAMVNSIAHYGLSSVGGLLQSLTGDTRSLADLASKEYEKKKQKAADKGEDFNVTEDQFTDMYIKGIVTSYKEVGLALALLGMYFFIKGLSEDDKDKDHVKDGLYKYTLRGIDKLQDEISFFYNPASFTSIVNGNVFPAISLATDAQKLFTNALKFGWHKVKGDDAAADKIKFMKYIYKDIPVTKELVNFQAIFSADFAKDNGIILQTQSGGH